MLWSGTLFSYYIHLLQPAYLIWCKLQTPSRILWKRTRINTGTSWTEQVTCASRKAQKQLSKCLCQLRTRFEPGTYGLEVWSLHHLTTATRTTLHECWSMPFGLKNGPETFQWYMLDILSYECVCVTLSSENYVFSRQNTTRDVTHFWNTDEFIGSYQMFSSRIFSSLLSDEPFPSYDFIFTLKTA